MRNRNKNKKTNKIDSQIMKNLNKISKHKVKI
jgi:hypothetical protein